MLVAARQGLEVGRLVFDVLTATRHSFRLSFQLPSLTLFSQSGGKAAPPLVKWTSEKAKGVPMKGWPTSKFLPGRRYRS
jgi:hypothetical protein